MNASRRKKVWHKIAFNNFDKAIRKCRFELNDTEYRESLVSELNEYGNHFNFIDITTPELIDEDSVRLQGTDPETQEPIILTILPKYYQYDINGQKRRY
jgi:hypothetical protein